MPAGPTIGWRDILARWDLVVPDLAERYGVHVWRDDVRWPELRDYIRGLLTVPSRLARDLAPKEPPQRH